MTQEHPITPPPELVKQWEGTAYNAAPVPYTHHIARCAARWGADQELEACEKYWLTHGISPEGVVRMRDARRPQPPSLKEQAFELVDRIKKAESVWAMSELDIIRRALESLPE